MLTRQVQETDRWRRDAERLQRELAEQQDVLNQLKAENDNLVMENGRGNGAGVVAEGGRGDQGEFSELNPEIMQRIARLEHENVELKAQLDSEAAAKLEALVDELDASQRLKKSFETKFFDTHCTPRRRRWSKPSSRWPPRPRNWST